MKNFKTNTKQLNIPDIDIGDSELNLFDPDNPDINLFNLIDDENIRLSGSKLYLYKYIQSEDFDPVYMESRNKPISKTPIVLHGHYSPKAIDENLTQFGIELTNDQVFTFNKSYIEQKINRAIIPGDIIKPQFQNMKYEIFQVVEDSFESYGVYHLVCFAKLLRDSEDIQDTPLLDVTDDLGGYSE